MANVSSALARRELSLIGKYDEATNEQWAGLMEALRSAGMLEADFDVMQADLTVRAYQRFLQLDQVEYDLLANFLDAKEAEVNAWYAEEKKKIDQWFEAGKLDPAAYSLILGKLNEAKLARFSNLHNLLSVVNKAKFQNGQFFNKAGALAAFSRAARKQHGQGTGHDMERLAKALAAERDELEVQSSAVGDFVEVEIEGKAEVSEVDAAMQTVMFQDIRKSISEKEG